MAAESALQTEAELAELADQVRKHFDDGCYGCGRANTIGIGIDGFRFDNRDLVAEFTPRIEYRGGPDVLHGGVTATALDEILAWAGMVTERVVVVTASLEVRYRKPIHIDGRPLVLRARMDDRNGRRLRLSGSLTVDGVEAAGATGRYVVMHNLDELLQEAL